MLGVRLARNERTGPRARARSTFGYLFRMGLSKVGLGGSFVGKHSERANNLEHVAIV